ncbi:MAG: PAS domain S-box protein, partial [Alphaproteobacteria bacterium]
GGTVVGVAGVVRDVTARRERRRELELWEAMVDAVADGLYALDADRTILAASEGFARIAGRDVESLLGEHISVCIEPSTIDENVEERRAVVAGEGGDGARHRRARRVVRGAARRPFGRRQRPPPGVVDVADPVSARIAPLAVATLACGPFRRELE